MLGSAVEFEELEREQVRLQFGLHFNDPDRFSEVQLVSSQEQLNDAGEIFQRSRGHIVAWPSLTDCGADALFTEQVREIIDERICGQWLRIPQCLQAPLENTIRLLLAEHGTAPRLVADIIHQQIQDFEAEYYPLFQETVGGRRVLYVLRVNQHLAQCV